MITGLAMNVFGPIGFYVFLTALLAGLAVYTMYRMTQRPAPAGADSGDFAVVLPTASVLTVEAAQDIHSHMHSEPGPQASKADTDPEEEEDEDIAV